MNEGGWVGPCADGEAGIENVYVLRWRLKREWDGEGWSGGDGVRGLTLSEGIARVTML